MSNAKLYKSMLNCDGTKKNCEGCVFRGIPDCRNAMAHHAGALIQLQDVVIDNAGQQSKAQMDTIRKLNAENLACMKENSQLNDVVVNLLTGLKEERHCASCEHSEAFVDPEKEAIRERICEECTKGESRYELNLEYGKKPDPCKGCIADSDECEGCAYNKDNE